ncbi:MAG: hypothetical protein HY718_08625 [Planctomycetes bacterium]|nr:hypothetical protein [Planctomycetota bacterium]
MPSTVSPTPPSQQYWLDRRWIHDNYARLVSEHANEWIAVHRGELLASGRDLGAVEDTARGRCSASDIVLQFIDDGSLIF